MHNTSPESTESTNDRRTNDIHGKIAQVVNICLKTVLIMMIQSSRGGIFTIGSFTIVNYGFVLHFVVTRFQFVNERYNSPLQHFICISPAGKTAPNQIVPLTSVNIPSACMYYVCNDREFIQAAELHGPFFLHFFRSRNIRHPRFS